MSTTRDNVAERLAHEYGCGVATIYRDAKFARNIDHIADAAGLRPNDVLDHRLPRRDLARIASLNSDAILHIFQELAEGAKWRTIRARYIENYHRDSRRANVDELAGIIGRAIKRYREHHPDLTDTQIERAAGMAIGEGAIR